MPTISERRRAIKQERMHIFGLGTLLSNVITGYIVVYITWK
jgi:hypothetical protein